MSGTGCAQAPRALHAAMDSEQENVKTLANRIDALTTRLIPVCRPGPEAAPGASDDPKPTLEPSLVTRRLQISSARIAALTVQVEDVLARLEVGEN